MTTFYDYDYTVRHDGTEVHSLRADTKRLPIGACTVSREPGAGLWVRKTVWRSKHGTWYEHFVDLDDALASGIRWVNRRTRQDRLERGGDVDAQLAPDPSRG